MRVAGRKPPVMVEIVQRALLEANLGKVAYEFRGEAASGRTPVEDVIRRWVTSDLPVPEAGDEPSAPSP